MAIEKDLAAAAELARALAHPVYDCLYLALAIREGAQVVTANRRFRAAVQTSPSHRSMVRLLRDWQARPRRPRAPDLAESPWPLRE